MINQTLTHHRIASKLGEGGMGEVYRATGSKVGHEVVQAHLRLAPRA